MKRLTEVTAGVGLLLALSFSALAFTGATEREEAALRVVSHAEARELYGAGCGPAVQYVGPGCGQTMGAVTCEPLNSIYNQFDEGSSNHDPVGYDCRKLVGGQWTICGRWDDLRTCGTR